MLKIGLSIDDKKTKNPKDSISVAVGKTYGVKRTKKITTLKGVQQKQMKKAYNGFIYDNTYNLDEYIPQMYEQLTGRFNYKTGYDNYFYDKAFTLLLGKNNEEIYEKDGYCFLDCVIVFPTSMAYDCTICWKKEEGGSLQFYWTTNFPDEELQDHINGRGLPDDIDL